MLDSASGGKFSIWVQKTSIRDEQRYHGYCDAMTRQGLAPLRINHRLILAIWGYSS